jgi:hypothetical protein
LRLSAIRMIKGIARIESMKAQAKPKTNIIMLSAN